MTGEEIVSIILASAIFFFIVAVVGTIALTVWRDR